MTEVDVDTMNEVDIFQLTLFDVDRLSQVD